MIGSRAVARRSPGLVVSGALAVLVLLIMATIGTLTPTGELISEAEPEPVETTRVPIERSERIDEAEGEFTQETEISDAGVTVINVFWLAVFAVLVMVAALLFAQGRGTSRDEEPHEMASHDGGHRGSLREVASLAVDEALVGLSAGVTVDDAIIECWRNLGRAAAEGGVSADRSRTSSELVAAVVKATPAAPADVAELAKLYRSARYSRRDATLVDVERARACLTAIQESLQ